MDEKKKIDLVLSAIRTAKDALSIMFGTKGTASCWDDWEDEEAKGLYYKLNECCVQLVHMRERLDEAHD